MTPMTDNDKAIATELDVTLVTFIHSMSCMGWALTKLRFSFGYEIHFASLSDPTEILSHSLSYDAVRSGLGTAHLKQWIADAERPKR